MNRRTWLTSLLALPLIPSVLRAAKVPDEPNTFPGAQTSSISVVANVKEWWTMTELSGGNEGGIEIIVHDMEPSKECLWICRRDDGTDVQFIAPHNMGPAEFRKRLEKS